MKTFEQIYNELQINENTNLKIAWREAKKELSKSNKITIILCIIIDILFVVMMYPNIALFQNKFSFFIIISSLLPIFVIDVIIYVFTKMIFSKNHNVYKNVFKENVIKKFISNFYTNVEYFHTKGIPQYIYEEGSYNEYYNRYYSEDYFEGYLQSKYSVQMAETKTQKVETHRDSDGRTKTTTTTIFYGLFAKIVMDKSINSKLKILQNGKLFLDNNKLKMDSSEFEKYFDVQASNKIIGMQLLTADVMEMLIDFRNKTNVKYDISIENNNLYLRFHLGEIFEPTNIKDGPLDKNSLEKYFYILNFTYNLSNRLINLVNESEI